MRVACTRGESCQFSHAGVAAANSGRTQLVETTKEHSHYFSIDVECIATAPDHNARQTAQISLVTSEGKALKNIYVKPTGAVASYLTPLTGLTKELLDERGVTIEEAMVDLRSALPAHAILVGQNIRKDVEWLGLREGVDFASMVDLCALFRAWNARFNSYTYFSLDHCATCCLGVANNGAAHDAVTDAIKSIQLFNLYVQVQRYERILEGMRRKLLATPVAASFAKLNPSYEGCCQGNRKTCTCGAPFLS